MASKTMVSFSLNGSEVDVVVEPRELLIHTLREKCQHTGPHIGCETSHCGACTVDFNGMSVKSCTLLTVQAQGAQVDLFVARGGPFEAAARFGECRRVEHNHRELPARRSCLRRRRCLERSEWMG